MKGFISFVLLFVISGTIFSFAQKIQAVHNAADPQLDLVDVYIELGIFPTQKIEDIAFRSATPFVEVPLPGATITVGIAPGNSTTINDTIKSFQITLATGVTYIGLVQGVLDTNQFAPNPDGLNISTDPIVNANGRETSNIPGEVDLFFINGVTDAPTIDINIRNGAKLVDNAAYGEYTDYFSLSPAAYTIDITDSSGNTVLYSYAMDLSAYADSALTLFASGFRDPASNQNGEPFGLFAVTAGGDIIEFSPPTAIDEPIANKIDEFILRQNYPNPFNPSTTISYQLAVESEVELTIYNTLGQRIRKLVQSHQPVGIYRVQWNGRDDGGKDVASGLYLYQLKTSDFVQGRKMLLLR